MRAHVNEYNSTLTVGCTYTYYSNSIRRLEVNLIPEMYIVHVVLVK